MRFLASLTHHIDRLCKAVIFSLFLVMVITTFLQIIFRYVFSAPLTWSEELSRYCLVWLTFTGAAVGIRTGIHVAVEALTRLLPARLKLLVMRFNYLLITVFAAALAKYGFELSMLNMKQLSPAMHIPIGLVYAAVPTGGLLILLFALEKLIAPGEEGGASS